MNAITILDKFAQELSTTYCRTADFDCYNSLELEIEHNGLTYCLDYSIIGKRQVKSELSMWHKNKQNEWVKCGIDGDLKRFIETSINQLIPILFDELTEAELEQRRADEMHKKDYKAMQLTYELLYISQR